MVLITFLTLAPLVPLSILARPQVNNISVIMGRMPSAGRIVSHSQHLTCSAGFSSCAEHQCCKTNEICCPGGVCCPEGFVCFADYASNIGCCPIGVTCGRLSDCTSSDQVQCPGETFCCPSGHRCSRHNAVPICYQEAEFVTMARRQGTSAAPPPTVEPPPTTAAPPPPTSAAPPPTTAAPPPPTSAPAPPTSAPPPPTSEPPPISVPAPPTSAPATSAAPSLPSEGPSPPSGAPSSSTSAPPVVPISSDTPSSLSEGLTTSSVQVSPGTVSGGSTTSSLSGIVSPTITRTSFDTSIGSTNTLISPSFDGSVSGTSSISVSTIGSPPVNDTASGSGSSMVTASIALISASGLAPQSATGTLSGSLSGPGSSPATPTSTPSMSRPSVLPEVNSLGSFDPNATPGTALPTAPPPSIQAFDQYPLTTTTTSYIPVPSNATVPPTAPDITYTGNWTDTPPVCAENVNTTTTARRSVGAGNMFSYSFKGTAIFLKLGTGRDSGVFRVELDGESQEVDSFSAVDDTCKIGYQKENLEDKQHTMIITTLGPSPQAPQTDGDGTVDIENIIVTMENLQPVLSLAISFIFNQRSLTVAFAWVVWFVISNNIHCL